MAAQLSHVYPLGSRVTEAGHLELGGCDAIELAREFGTPAYVVVEDDVRERARAFVAAYAARCDGLRGPLRLEGVPVHGGAAHPVRGGPGLRRRLGRRAGDRAEGRLRPARIHLHGNAKSAQEIAEAVDAGVGHVVVDNHTDIDLLEELVPAGAVQRVQLRVAPGISPDTHPSISTGGPNTKFGFGLQSAPAAIERLDASDRLELEGLHLHIGSQIYDVGSFRTALEAMAGLASHGMVNLGGGLGVAYVSAEHPPTIEEYVAAKVSAVHDVMGPGVRDPRRAGTRARRQLDRHPVHGAVDEAQRRPLRRRRRRHVRQPAPDALRRALRGAGRVALRRRDATATWWASTASRAT